jgi:hypothetical protein
MRITTSSSGEYVEMCAARLSLWKYIKLFRHWRG